MPGTIALMGGAAHRRGGTGGAGGAAPVNQSAPVISGGSSVGSTLTSTQGTWLNSPTSITYQWKRAATTNLDADSQYLVVTADVDQALTCVVTATNASGSASATSNTITPTAEAPTGTLYWSDSFDHDADGHISDFQPEWAGFARTFANRGETMTAAQAGFSPRVGTHCMRMTANNSDTNTGPWSGDNSIGTRPPTNNCRCQLEPQWNQPWGNNGATTYYHSSIRVPTGTLPTPPNFGLAMQWHGDPFSGSPCLALNVASFDANANTFSLGNAVSNPNQRLWQDSTVIQRNVWYDFTFLVHWSGTSNGYVQFWKNGVAQQLSATRAGTLSNGGLRWNGVTLKGDQLGTGTGGGAGVSFYAATNYRGAGSVAGDVTYYFDACKAGSTFEIVQP